MSLEQLNCEPVDERSDLFAVGVMIFEALTGRSPFTGDTFSQRILSLTHVEPQLPVIKESDQLLNEVLRKCLTKNTADRFSSALELRQAIIPLISAYHGHAGVHHAAGNV